MNGDPLRVPLPSLRSIIESAQTKKDLISLAPKAALPLQPSLKWPTMKGLKLCTKGDTDTLGATNCPVSGGGDGCAK